jgi:cell cycle checkpoint protein
VCFHPVGLVLWCSTNLSGSAFLDKSLFTTYTFNPPSLPRILQDLDEDDEAEAPALPAFQISLTALLETLQIFGLTDPNTTRPPWARDNPYPTSTAFSNNVLGMNNLCRISYDAPGAPLSVILTEASIRTSCDLTTYEAEFADEIPFDRHSLAFKTIMRGSWLYDAVSELSSTSPEKLTMYAKITRGKPFFALSSSGTLGSARVEFNNQSQPSAYRTPAPTNPNAVGAESNQPPTSLLETFQLSDPESVLKASYKFSLIQKAARAMSIATKVSVRVDAQDVLSMQFMIEVDGNGGTGSGDVAAKVSFVDFRFVPLVEDEEEVGAEVADETLMQTGGRSDGSEMDED